LRIHDSFPCIRLANQLWPKKRLRLWELAHVRRAIEILGEMATNWLQRNGGGRNGNAAPHLARRPRNAKKQEEDNQEANAFVVE